MNETQHNEKQNLETVTLGGGCFWCLEAVYVELRGVEKVASGYAGGHVKRPTYREVCNGATGHAEVVQVTFDPSVISLHDILRVFFTIHDPTTLNRQGADVGTQYRSIILYHDATQQQVAREVMDEMAQQRIWPNPLVTELAPLGDFYPAEEYHQDYFARNPKQPYCQVVIAPKVAKFRKQYFQQLKR
ncbi:peptide-methionine (S)-S-oxide reductase MsrA [Caldilinea sp.]|uniref:peptide-methionine (S)-S-oxide reductase MsrA n=1 Tax=Caldilinea sp. TaxID=2293560 RepID=UPI002B6ED5FE|nr:peptide-methionine (S)-S-oxide reductase MsrA [Caldilinea sp.]HRA64975.1 peptide-methionine (S)-S-oxide reductase MsrA [Caldilinea sp.]